MTRNIFPAFLVNRRNETYFLRGFFYWPDVNGSQLTIFTDLLPYVRKVVAKSFNMYIEPAIPNFHSMIGKKTTRLD
jgi:hypothetical protein